ncbi:MAG TPA: hypothetical protein VIG77_18140 [Ktedonobacterales bacterium]|jgi:hypothetical protein
MIHALATTDPITPEWLTEALRAAGELPTGAVSTVEARANDAFNSAAAHLTLTYSNDAPADAPRQLFLKRNLATEWAVEAGRDEALFYQAMAAHRDRLPMLIPCYVALIDEARSASTLLMPDVSATHASPLGRDDQISETALAVPDAPALDQAIDALAGFHAAWWQRPELGQGSAAPFALYPLYGDAAQFAAHVERRRGEWEQFIATEGAWFPADLRAIYESALTRLPLLWEEGLGERMTTRRGLTLTHGDCYLSQFLCPRSRVVAPTYLVDFQGSYANLVGEDLVHMFAFWWTREQRREGDREMRSLRRYHDGLLAGNVRDYSWNDLLAEYRRGLTLMLFFPIWDETNGSAQSYWLPKLHNIVAAYQDHCLP